MQIFILCIQGISAITDLNKTKISNNLLLVGTFAGMLLKCLWKLSPWQEIMLYAINFILPLVILYPLYLLKQMGAGDIKLLCVTSAYFKFKFAVISLACGVYLSIIPIIIIAVKQGKIKGIRIPLSPFIFAGTLICIVFRKGGI